jgi:hypothetical protein
MTQGKTTHRSSIWRIEFLAEGCAIITRADNTHETVMACDVPELLLREARDFREKTYGG